MGNIISDLPFFKSQFAELVFQTFLQFSDCTTNGVTVTIPDVTNSSLYYLIDAECYRLDACVEVPIAGVSFTKSLKAYLELDPCNLVMRAGFESRQKSYVMVNYEWGMYHMIGFDKYEILLCLQMKTLCLVIKKK